LTLYFDKYIRNRSFLGCKAKKQSGLFGRNEAENFSVLPIPHRRIPQPRRGRGIPCDGIRETWCVWLFHGYGIWKMYRVFVSPCRGVLHTPHKRPSEGGRGPCLWSWTGIRHPRDGAWWGVCNTPLPWRSKNDHGRGMFCRITRKIGCLWGMPWDGRWKMWCVFVSLC